jgi:cytochrome b561
MGEYLVGTLKRYFPVSNATANGETAFERQMAAVAGHSKAVIAAHWGTVLAIVISVVAVYCRELTEDKALRVILLDLHRQLGLLVIIVVPLRIIFRFCLRFANHSIHVPPILHWARQATHVATYSFLVIAPLLGWASTNAHRVSLKFLGVVPLPSLVAPDPDVADMLADYHTWAFYALGALVALHATAALVHHFVLRDGVLVAMLGGRRSQHSMHDRQRA